jgi:hypothetical protein
VGVTEPQKGVFGFDPTTGQPLAIDPGTLAPKPPAGSVTQPPKGGGGGGGGEGMRRGDAPPGTDAPGIYNKLLTAFQNSKLVGVVPPDGARFGITTGSAEEWARFATSIANEESSFKPWTKNEYGERSYGIFQYDHSQVPGGNAFNVDASISAFVRDAETSVREGGIRDARGGKGGRSLLARRFSTIGNHPERAIRSLPLAGRVGVTATGGRGPVTADPAKPFPWTPSTAGGAGGGDVINRDISHLSQGQANVGAFNQAVKGLVVHHTSGRGTPEGVATTFQQRGYPAQFIIDREGNIVRYLPEGASGAHVKPGQGIGKGLGNWNLEGVEVIARNEKDVLPIQREAVARLLAERAARHGYDPKTGVFGHGEINPHKERNEGSTAQMIREGKIAIPDRAVLDRAQGREITSKVNATGKLDVTVRAPKRTRVGVKGSGVFAKTELDRQTTMPTTPRQSARQSENASMAEPEWQE